MKNNLHEIIESAEEVKSWNKYGEETSYKWLCYAFFFILGFSLSHYILTPYITAWAN